MYQVIKTKLDGKDRLTLSEMAYKNSRKQVCAYISTMNNFSILFISNIYLILFYVFSGSAKVLYFVSFEKVSSVRAKPGLFIRRNSHYQRSQMG